MQTDNQTQNVEVAQAAYLEHCAPGYRTRPVQSSGGTTQIIELGDWLLDSGCEPI